MTQSHLTTGQVAENIGGILHGDPSVRISGVSPLDAASGADLSFLAPRSKKQTAELIEAAKKSAAGAILLSKQTSEISIAQIVTPDPLKAIIQIANLLRPVVEVDVGVNELASVAESASIGEGVSIGAYAVVGKDVRIGNNVVIHPHVVIYPGVIIGDSCVIHAGAVVREHCVIGDDCLIQPGAVVGSDGFGYKTDENRKHHRIPHIGNAVVESSVDIGANTTIDRATFGETKISTGAKIDNLAMIGHNTLVGERTILCGQVGIAGSCKVGNDSVLGGQVGVADHVTIGDKVLAAGGSSILSNTKGDQTVAGYPAIDASDWKRIMVSLRRLPEIIRHYRSSRKDT